MKSIWKGVGVASGLALTLAACSDGGGGSSGDVQIEFQTDIASDNEQLERIREITEDFEAENEGISVEVLATTGDYEADMKVLMASDDLPDLFMTHGWSLERYGPFLEPLDDREWAENFNPALDAAMRSDDDEFYALPINTDISGVVYNKTVVEEAGIDVTELTTWDDFNDALAKLAQDGDITPLASSGKDEWLTGNVADFIASGAFDDATLERFDNGEFAGDEYGKILELVEEWRDNDYINPDYSSISEDEIVQSFAQDETAFLITQNGVVNQVYEYNPDAEMGFMPVPAFDGEAFLVGGEGQAIGIAENSEVKDEALEYLDYIAQPENLKILAAGVNGPPGLDNVDIDLGELEDSYEQFDNEDEYPLWPYFDRVHLPNGMWDTMITTTESIFTGQGTVESSIDQLTKDYDSLYDQ